ncbi:hypothetical protein RJT34_22816 [Clitoria ternatea]|uniref:Uncharacterized protein n=1 Tax=Clitoria ternatea TaxID=43366 RepID=A0AAN9FK11_CLITE
MMTSFLNPERISEDSKQEIQVHGGCLSAYDSARTGIISLIRLAIGYVRKLFVRDNPRVLYACNANLVLRNATLEFGHLKDLTALGLLAITAFQNLVIIIAPLFEAK